MSGHSVAIQLISMNNYKQIRVKKILYAQRVAGVWVAACQHCWHAAEEVEFAACQHCWLLRWTQIDSIYLVIWVNAIFILFSSDSAKLWAFLLQKCSKSTDRILLVKSLKSTVNIFICVFCVCMFLLTQCIYLLQYASVAKIEQWKICNTKCDVRKKRFAAVLLFGKVAVLIHQGIA